MNQHCAMPWQQCCYFHLKLDHGQGVKPTRTSGYDNMDHYFDRRFKMLMCLHIYWFVKPWHMCSQAIVLQVV